MKNNMKHKSNKPYLKNQSQIRNIQWNQNHLWDIKFEDAPPPFNTWFPATDFNLNLFSTSSHSLSSTYRDYKVPVGTSGSSLSVTCPDTVDTVLWNWMKAWFEEIYNDPKGLSTVSESVRRVYIAKLSPTGSMIGGKPESYLVYPEGSMSWSGGSDSSITTTPYEFVVVERSS